VRHDFIDKYSHRNSVIHRLDPRIKLILSFSFLVLLVATSNIKLFGMYLGLVTFLVAISHVPIHFFLKKLLLVTPLAVLFSVFLVLSYLVEKGLPFSVETITSNLPIYHRLALLVSKIYLSILILSLMVASTRFNDLLWGMRKIRFPMIVTTLSKLVYTYIFIFIDELHRTFRAYKSRTPVRRVRLVKVYGSIAAAILVRSIDRSDNIYKAMVSRGFDGEFPEGNFNRLKLLDLTAATLFLAMACTARLLLWTI
jgi:cobalt/nickel transport system permease protein